MRTIEKYQKPIFSPDRKTVWFGNYPQTKVSDENLIKQLNDIQAKVRRQLVFLDDEAYIYCVAYARKNPVMILGLFDPDEYEKHLNERRFDDGSEIILRKRYWFKCEPIEWKVVVERDGKCLLITKKLLDRRTFFDGDKIENFTVRDEKTLSYFASDLRYSLNNFFVKYNFLEGEEYILKTDVDNLGTMLDKAFAPSYEEMMNPLYGFPIEKEEGYGREAKTTDWARAKGADFSTEEDTYGNGIYWTRTIVDKMHAPHHLDFIFNTAYVVDYDGSITQMDVDFLACIRPMIVIDSKRKGL